MRLIYLSDDLVYPDKTLAPSVYYQTLLKPYLAKEDDSKNLDLSQPYLIKEGEEKDKKKLELLKAYLIKERKRFLDFESDILVQKLITLASDFQQCIDAIVNSISEYNVITVTSRILLFAKSRKITVKDVQKQIKVQEEESLLVCQCTLLDFRSI